MPAGMCWPTTCSSLAQNTLWVPNRHIVSPNYAACWMRQCLLRNDTHCVTFLKRQSRFEMHVLSIAVLPFNSERLLAGSILGSCSRICTQNVASLAPSQSAQGQMQAEMPWTPLVLALAAQNQYSSLLIAPSHHTGWQLVALIWVHCFHVSN